MLYDKALTKPVDEHKAGMYSGITSSDGVYNILGWNVRSPALDSKPGARLSKLPKLSGFISGAIISYVSQNEDVSRNEILQ